MSSPFQNLPPPKMFLKIKKALKISKPLKFPGGINPPFPKGEINSPLVSETLVNPPVMYVKKVPSPHQKLK